MFTRLKWLWDRTVHEASQRARAFVDGSGECRATGVSLQADEAERWVFAVFFQSPVISRPIPYKLIAVHKQSCEISELQPPEVDRYRPRGYK